MKNVLISGAGIAGPALAHWLAAAGCTVTVVERAPAPRPGGQAVDFKGEAHLKVLERMGVLDDIRRLQTGGTDQTIIDAEGRTLGTIPGEFTGGTVEIHRGDLATLLHDHTADRAEYIFGDTITSLTQTDDGVHTTFHHTPPRTFDLVVGADGIHSTVRRLAFGPEKDFVEFLGHYYALADIELDSDPVMYNEPGRMVAIGGPKSPAFLVFASPELEYDRYDVEQHKQIVARAYRGGGWRIPELLDRLPHTENLYLDTISRVHVPTYSRGRVVLLGDSAYGNTLGGFGSGFAVVGAYVLAGELLAAGDDHRTAFTRYESLFRGYTKVAAKANAGPFLAPPTRARMAMRNWMFRSPLMLKLMLKSTDWFATSIDLPDYTFTPTPA
ncbi:FAD-dependent monooxygenase [Saccharothrix variisporea]|uniref:2-polyprenyl-6-methoxyphenol hydroxylase-like FAD-dependent oxidoreductase n=1 Tax=Saccharothrix variisporea TaxID=543527 RepID=A0A495X8X2_9PSEU|nr:FAD-dependent monooxygenase [Saccharothrix variisporea]RKT70911.1 2-polyprenyl-6-methoxyphenol hydroxylase-like FAD-dependent oxidoreductase [Saccharothrix variisporea]